MAKAARLPILHGLYYAVTGFWPLVSIGTFQLITGPKRDLWLVKTAGALIGVIGCVLALAGLRQRVTPEIELLGAGAALSLATIDAVYVKRRTIRRIYLADAAVELVFATGYAFCAVRAGQDSPDRWPPKRARTLPAALSRAAIVRLPGANCESEKSVAPLRTHS